MILLSKANASFTELEWSAQLFLVREFCMFISYLALPVFICPMLRVENYHVYPSAMLKNEVLQKLVAKSEGESKNWQRIARFIVTSWVPVFLCKYGARWMWPEKCLIFTPSFHCLTGRQALLVGKCFCLWNHLPSNEGKWHTEGDSPSQGGGWEHLGASHETLVILQVQCCSCRYIWSCFLDILFCSLAKW